MITVNPYVNFSGNTEEAFEFYKSVFGGEYLALQRFSDTPHGDNLPEADKGKIMHIALPIGSNTILMGTDVLESMGQRLTKGDNFSLAINPGSFDEGQQLFTALSTGGTVGMPFEKAFWGAYFGLLTDKFGIQWMINYEDKSGDSNHVQP